LTRATGLTATAFAVAGFGIACAIAGFGPNLLAFTETELDCAAALAAGTAAGFTRTPTIGALFVPCAALGPTLAGFAAEACAGLFVPEVVFAFGPATAGFPEAGPEAIFWADTAGFSETAFWVDVAGFVAGITLTETAGFTFGGATVPVAFAPFGEGLATGLVGCTLTVAAAVGFCTAVGVCANAAADKSMSVPRFRMI